MVNQEKDPHGTDQHAPGAKLDAGKARPDLILSDMPRAIMEVARVAAFGAQKYTEGGWQHVPDGVKRYTAAMDRHRLATEVVDDQTGLAHAAHLAWNALARLELMMREQERTEERPEIIIWWADEHPVAPTMSESAIRPGGGSGIWLPEGYPKPRNPNDRVVVELRSGHIAQGRASEFDWSRTGAKTDVIRWRPAHA